jgi:hypothetical protein
VYLAAAILAGCGSKSNGHERNGSDIIGGFSADSPSLNAIGLLATSKGGMCTATLISPTTVLTAKHCIVDDAGSRLMEDLGSAVAFAIGPRPLEEAEPRFIPAISTLGAPLNGTGGLGLGSDVAIVHLADPVIDIEPLRIGPDLHAADIGMKFFAVGYGQSVQDDSGATPWVPRRLMGNETLTAVTGNRNEIAYGSFEAWVFAVSGKPVSEHPEADLAEARAHFDSESSKLLDGYEVMVGQAPGDIQVCSGDSGGPLLRQDKGEKLVYGVASFVFPDTVSKCNHGAVYGTFGPGTREFIEAAVADPCRGLDSQGACVILSSKTGETAAFRCSDETEGAKRVTRVDCAPLGLVCGRDPAGRVACVDP